MELVEVDVTATSGDFDTFASLAAFWKTKPTPEQPSSLLDLGAVANIEGLGAAFSLKPTRSINLLDLINNAHAEPADACPELEVSVTGFMPVIMPVWDMTMKVRLSGSLG